ncbi:MAG: hypothetical protein F6K39_47960 [Okeania sp. SIO3B3]|nr:hypothetical protein [Okeania sp. SIO3B3]
MARRPFPPGRYANTIPSYGLLRKRPLFILLKEEALNHKFSVKFFQEGRRKKETEISMIVVD